MNNLSKLVAILTVMGVLVSFVFYYVSSPDILIAMKHQDSTKYGGQNIPITIATEDNRFNQFSNVCFRIENQGQPTPIGEIPASNFKANLMTNAICKECTTSMNYQTLYPQNAQTYCHEIKAPTDINTLTFEVIVDYDAIIHRSVSNNFVCELTDNDDNVNKYSCN